MRELLAGSVESAGRLTAVCEALHDSPEWTLPPSSNLTDINDLMFIEPMLIALAARPAGPSERPNGKSSLSLARLLHTASSFGFEHAVSSFLSLLGDAERDAVNAEDESGHTVLERACFANKPRIVEQLITAGADVTRAHRKLGTTALHTAISMRFSECASLLIGAYRQSGLPLPIDSMGRTLLHVAACAGTDGQDILSGEKYSEEVRAFIAELLSQLVDHGVDPTARDLSGRTALDLAAGRGDETTVAALEGLMTAEQRAVCVPRTFLRHSIALPMPAVRAAKEMGVCMDDFEGGRLGIGFNWTKLSPSAPAAAAGPKVLLMKTGFTAADECLPEILVAELGATCWLIGELDVLPAVAPPKGTFTMARNARRIAHFIKEHCSGGVDCATAWCHPAEALCRIAVAQPELLRACLLTSSECYPEDREKRLEVIRGMVALDGGMAQFAAVALANVPNPAFKEETELAALHRSRFAEWMKMVDTTYAGSYTEEYGPAGILEDSVRNNVYWRHWSEVKQRVHLLSGADDCRGLRGMLNLVATVPNASIDVMPGVSHFPFCEASELWIEKSVAFVASLGFERCAAARE